MRGGGGLIGRGARKVGGTGVMRGGDRQRWEIKPVDRQKSRGKGTKESREGAKLNE